MTPQRIAQIKQEIAAGTYDLLPGTCPLGCVEFTAERLAQEIETMDHNETSSVDVVDLAKRFASVHTERAKINKEFDKLKEEVETIFVARNVPSIAVGDKLVHLIARDRPIPMDGCEDELFDAFEADDETKHLVSRTLRGITEWMGELPKDERTLETIFPPHVKDLIRVVTKVSAGVRKRTKKTKGGAS